jgi:hypothetical protein
MKQSLGHLRPGDFTVLFQHLANAKKYGSVVDQDCQEKPMERALCYGCLDY